MTESGKPGDKARRILERSNKPILFLAGLAVVLYILELFRVIPNALITPFLWLNFIIDFIFLIDLTAKCLILGRSYIRSPWFFIDFISTLPIISSAFELAGSLGPQLQATRVARAARVARIARVARLAKVARVARLVTAIRARQGLTFLKSADDQETPKFNRSLLIAVPILLLVFILANNYITSQEVNRLETQIQERLNRVKTPAALEAVLADYPLTNDFSQTNELFITPSPLDPDNLITLSVSKAHIRASRIAGIMLLVVLATIGMSVYISSSLAKDKSSSRERSILSQCFSPIIVDKFYETPEVVERYFNHWMTVFFIDIRGFTQVTEKQQNDVEGLALKLRKVMDTARKEIVETHEGIVDKFMGDAVMGWVGGHFSQHWALQKDEREKLFIDEIDLINQDIKKIEREIKHQQAADNKTETIQELKAIFEVARKDEAALLDLQKKAKQNDPNLEEKYQAQSLAYRQAIAASAVSCCLRISNEVLKITDADGLQKLKMGIGSGSVLVGNFGSSDQIAFTVLGPTVNRAARLEPASAQLGCKMLVDQDTYDLLKDNEKFKFRKVPRISVKGIDNDLATYEPFFADQEELAFIDEFNKGAEAIERGEKHEALGFFKTADLLRPGGDSAAKLWQDLSEDALTTTEQVGAVKIKK